jgi:hypothetical protein
MKLLDYFNRFLANTVNLNQSRLDDLDSRVDSITNALKSASNLADRVIDTVPQGSWAHRTIIRPAADVEFDADFLVQLSEETAWSLDPKQYSNAVKSALNSHGVYSVMSSTKNRCIRVSYVNDCHIDVVPYVILSSGREVIINRATNEFEDTNPVGFTEWLQGKDDLTGGNLRKAIRLLKYLRDHRDAFTLKSVLLTTLVGNIVESWRAYDPSYYQDVPTTLVHLVVDLDVWLQARPSRPSLFDPSCPSTTFDHRWTDSQCTTFRTKVHDLAPKLLAAYDASGVDASITAWQDIFGTAFPSSLTKSLTEVITEGASAVSKAVKKLDRAPNERFIEEEVPVNESHHVQITCEVSEPTYPNRAARRHALRSRHGRVPRRRDLLFKIVETDVVAPFEVRWKIRNTGNEAKSLGALRGEIHRDEGRHLRRESTKYVGHHYVECYIIKDGVCVARAHEKVVID